MYSLKKIFKGILIVFILCCPLPLLAKNAVYEGTDYNLALNYTDVVYPGDAIALVLDYSPKTSIFSSKKQFYIVAKADLMIAGSRKTLRSSELFGVDENNQHLLGFIPLSTWYTAGNFSVKVIYQIFEKNKEQNTPLTESLEFEIPIIMKDKQFKEETIHLNATNTAIKTDTSTSRFVQIDTLNKILQQINMLEYYQISPFSNPVNSTTKTAFFGDRRTYAYSDGTSSQSLHYGIDFGVPVGTPIYSCGDGKVVLTENRISTGWTVVIEHLPGVYSLYYHLDKYSVKVGQIVKQGEQIAVSGSTGLATGPHLHWEMRINGYAVNPEWFINDFPNLIQD